MKSLKKILFLSSVVAVFNNCGGNNELITLTVKGTFVSSKVAGIYVCTEDNKFCTITNKEGKFYLSFTDYKFRKNIKLNFNLKSKKGYFVNLGTVVLNANNTEDIFITPTSFIKDTTKAAIFRNFLHLLGGDTNLNETLLDLSKIKISNLVLNSEGCSATSIADLINENCEFTLTFSNENINKQIKMKNSTLQLCQNNNCTEYNAKYLYDWLILIYMAADNNLSRYSFEDIKEIKSVVIYPTIKVAIIQDTYGDNGGYIYESNDFDGSLNLVHTIPEPNMGDAQTLIDFVINGVKKYPAKKVFLILWNHGYGWRNYLRFGNFKLAAQDESNGNDYLYMFELKEALEKLKIQGIKINLIGFDECLMGNLEVFYDIANYTNYVVASEYYEPAPGWDYSILLNKLNKNPTATEEKLAHYVVDAYKEAYYDSDYSDIFTMIAISTKDVNSLVGAVNKMAKIYLSNPPLYHDAYLNAVPNPIPDSGNLIDLYTFSMNLNDTTNGEGTNQVIEIIRRLYKWSNDKNYHGISIYLPAEKNNVDNLYFCTQNSNCTIEGNQKYYNPFTETLWDDFLKAFLDLD